MDIQSYTLGFAALLVIGFVYGGICLYVVDRIQRESVAALLMGVVAALIYVAFVAIWPEDIWPALNVAIIGLVATASLSAGLCQQSTKPKRRVT